jgi:hypothetical protein
MNQTSDGHTIKMYVWFWENDGHFMIKKKTLQTKYLKRQISTMNHPIGLNHPNTGIETATGEGKTTNDKKFGNHPRNEI